MPKKAKIRLFHNGKPAIETSGKELIYNDLAKGKYRVEIFYRGLYKSYPWAFSNPIIVE